MKNTGHNTCIYKCIHYTFTCTCVYMCTLHIHVHCMYNVYLTSETLRIVPTDSTTLMMSSTLGRSLSQIIPIHTASEKCIRGEKGREGEKEGGGRGRGEGAGGRGRGEGKGRREGGERGGKRQQLSTHVYVHYKRCMYMYTQVPCMYPRSTMHTYMCTATNYMMKCKQPLVEFFPKS